MTIRELNNLRLIPDNQMVELWRIDLYWDEIAEESFEDSFTLVCTTWRRIARNEEYANMHIYGTGITASTDNKGTIQIEVQ